MEDNTKTKDSIEQEVERRLKEKMGELETQIREQVKSEYKEKEAEIEQPETAPEKPAEKTFERFGANFRFQHIVLLSSTVMLILTGVPLKFPKNSVSQFIIEMFGGAAGARSVHHFFALGLIFIGIYHLVYSFWSRRGRKDFYELLPSLKDFSDVFNQMKYYLGFRKEKVKYGRFSYVEKFDYWAVYWGLIMMIGTGMIMWFFQGEFEPLLFGRIELSFGPDMITNTVYAIAREMHSDEALLATLVIVGWHFYNVHGKMSEKEMIDEHPLEYEEIIKQEKKS
jgi:formate dehydrogenase subunit gamma